MFTITNRISVFVGSALAGAALFASAHAADENRYGFGAPVDENELTQFVSPLPDGRGMPEGSGSVMDGKDVYMQHCLACHGAELEGGYR